MVFAEALNEYLIDGLSALAGALEQVLTFRSTSAIEVYETLREALAGDPGDA